MYPQRSCGVSNMALVLCKEKRGIEQINKDHQIPPVSLGSPCPHGLKLEGDADGAAQTHMDDAHMAPVFTIHCLQETTHAANIGGHFEFPDCRCGAAITAITKGPFFFFFLSHVSILKSQKKKKITNANKSKNSSALMFLNDVGVRCMFGMVFRVPPHETKMRHAIQAVMTVR